MIRRELQLAVRRLLRDRWAASGAIIAAALGAGLNTAVFAVAYGILARPLPYTDASRLVVVDAASHVERLADWRARLPSFARAGAYAREALTVEGLGEPRLANVAIVDDEFFSTLGGQPRRGRAVAAAGDEPFAVLSDRFATQSGATTPGAPIVVGGSALNVGGIMPPGFDFPGADIDLWMPVTAARAIAFDQTSDARRYRLIGRLRPGVTLAEATADVDRARAQIDPQGYREPGRPSVQRLEDVVVGSARPVLLAFAAAGLMVLLIACANVATILVGRTLARRRELAVRRALGASPRQLVASVLAESIVVTGAGSLVALGIATLAVRLVRRWGEGLLPRLTDIRIDANVLAFAAGATAIAALLSALPAFRSLRTPAAQDLRLSGGGGIRVERRLRGALVVIQIALAVVLLAGGALLARTIVSLLGSGVGTDTGGAAATSLLLTERTSFTAGSQAPVVRAILDRVRALPGVTAAGVGSNLPPDRATIAVTVRLVGPTGTRESTLAFASATPGFLPAIGARFVAGRDFADSDLGRGKPVIVLSESTARALMPPGDPVGRDFPAKMPGARTRPRATVIGVVRDIKYRGLEADAGPSAYVLWSDMPAGHVYLTARTSGNTLALAPAIRAVVRDVAPRLPAMPFRTLDDIVGQSVADRRLRALLGGSVALLAFAVAMVGLAGSLMRVVSERRQELAIRAALGASPARAVAAIVREGALLAALGVALGIGLALALGRALGTLVRGVSPHDPATLAAVAAIVTLASLAACYAPARRAAAVDPLVLLRAD